MKVLVAEDDPFFRRLLEQLLAGECEVNSAHDGNTAWAMIQEGEAPVVAILDWVMPGMTGPQVCRVARANPKTANSYLILLTAKNSSADILAGLRSGADDYVTKPFEPEELRARVRIGCRIAALQKALQAQQIALENAQARVQALQSQLQSLEQNRPKQETAKAASA